MTSRSFVTTLRIAFLFGYLAGLQAHDSIIEESGILNSNAVRSFISKSFIHNSTLSVSKVVLTSLIGVTSNLSMVHHSEIYNSTLAGYDEVIGDMKPKDIFSPESSNKLSLNRINGSLIFESKVGTGDLRYYGNSTVEQSWVAGSVLETSNVTASTLRGSRLFMAEIGDSIVLNSYVINSNVSTSRILEDTILSDSNIDDSNIIDSYIFNCTVLNRDV